MYNWIADTFGLPDGLARGLAFAVALAIVLLLIALFVFILKRLTGVRLSSARGRQPRLTVMDATNIDTRRRLLLIRRDNVEHLILVGGSNDLVIEQGIVKAAGLGTSVQSRSTPSNHLAYTGTDGSSQGLPSSIAVASYAANAQQDPETDRPAAEAVEPTRAAPPPAQLSVPPEQFAPSPVPASSAGPSVSQHQQARTAPKTTPEPRTTYQRPFAAASSRAVERATEAPSPEQSLVKAAVSARGTVSPAQPPVSAARGAPAVSPVPGRGQYRPPESAAAPQIKTPAASVSASTAPAIPASHSSSSMRPPVSQQESQVAGFARTLARPALAPASSQPQPPRQVTPPSSGPAAKAKTVFLQPVTAAAVDLPSLAQAVPAAEKDTVPVEKTEVPPLKAEAAQEPVTTTEAKPALQEASAETSPAIALNTVNSPEPHAPETPEEDTLQLDETMQAEPEVRPAAVETSTGKEPVPAEDSDLFEPSSEPVTAKEEAPEDAQPEDAQAAKADVLEAAEKDVEEIKIEAPVPVVAAPVSGQQPSTAKAPEISVERGASEANAAPPIRVERPKEGPLPNPIEDEMAKLLEEMTGPQRS
ncbi:flagellar biosynthetic protein FliO [Roseibium litorale]|uniref:Flagellar biosynthetic protein FliO n=1 Tax=Roseibium litorale TaxID=2803841 RepID=A0ABR9CHU5_9HYPH|nr:flagellar biosynthetic protein FliO [Roseibium litorale]MBD8890407.1 flagellar biosynthetic protein FliO [Roseibium litorale]